MERPYLRFHCTSSVIFSWRSQISPQSNSKLAFSPSVLRGGQVYRRQFLNSACCQHVSPVQITPFYIRLTSVLFHFPQKKKSFTEKRYSIFIISTAINSYGQMAKFVGAKFIDTRPICFRNLNIRRCKKSFP